MNNKRGVGRPKEDLDKKITQISIGFTSSDLERLKNAATANDCSIAEVVRQQLRKSGMLVKPEEMHEMREDKEL